MNEPHDPNATSDASAPPPADALRTTDHVRASASTDGSHPRAEAPASDLPVVPGYRVQREIARGGMGRVLAAYDLTLDREVALKILLPGAYADRFVRESKITARLPHPGVPPVYALGTLADGSPFLAMKLIAGQTLADEMTSGDRPRLLQAFVQVCQAVGFAHSRGIIHRDLKPANIMVGAFGEVQVMDWGLAKDLTGPDVADPLSAPQASLERAADPGATTAPCIASASTAEGTQAGQIMGTPAYMAPEQARGNPTDARSDVFALGGILCALLTGQPPFGGKSSLEVVQRAAAADLAAAHKRLDRCEADEELVALCRRCLSPDARDRPANGQAVADELAAYLGGVQEKLRKAELAQAAAQAQAREEAKRRRLALVLGGAVAAVLVVGIVGTTVGLLRANAAADKELSANEAAQTAKTTAEKAAKAEEAAKVAAQQSAAAEKAANDKTQKRLAQIEKGVELFAGLLKGIDPAAEKVGGEPLYVQLRKRAEKAADALDAEAVGDPLATVRLQTMLGSTLIQLGSHAKAVELMEKALVLHERELGAEHPALDETRYVLAKAYLYAEKLPEAIALGEQLRDTLVKKLGADHPATFAALNNLGLAYECAGRLQEAIAIREQLKNAGAKMPWDPAADFAARGNLARSYYRAGKLTEGIKLLEQLKDDEVKHLGPDHFMTLITLNDLAVFYEAAGRNTEALALYERIKDDWVKKLGADHPAALVTLGNLATAYRKSGQFAKAVLLYEETLEKMKAKLGPDHQETLNTTSNLAQAYWQSDQRAKAMQLYEQTLEKMKAKLAAGHPITLATMANLAEVYEKSDQRAKATQLYEETLEKMKAKLGPDHPDTLQVQKSLAFCRTLLTAEGRYGARLAELGPKHIDTLLARRDLAQMYMSTNRLDDAELVLLEVLHGMNDRAPDDAILVFTTGLLRRCLTQRQRATPDAWQTFNTQVMLGGVLLSQKKYAEAEPLLVKGYEGMKKQRDKIPPAAAVRLAQAVERLVQLYEATDKTDEAARWRKELDALKREGKKGEKQP